MALKPEIVLLGPSLCLIQLQGSQHGSLGHTDQQSWSMERTPQDLLIPLPFIPIPTEFYSPGKGRERSTNECKRNTYVPYNIIFL